MTNEEQIEKCARLMHEAFLAHAASIHNPAWDDLPAHNQITYRVVAGALLKEYSPRNYASRGLMRYCGHCGYDVALAPDDHCADCGGVTHDTRAEYEQWAAQHAVSAASASLDMVSVERVHDLLERIDEYAMPGSSQEDLIREARTHTAVLMGIPAPVYDDEDAEAAQEAIEAQRQAAHDADIDSRGYEPYGEGSR